MNQHHQQPTVSEPLLVTVAAAADRLGVTPFEALALAEDGRIASEMVGPRRYISTASLAEFASADR